MSQGVQIILGYQNGREVTVNSNDYHKSCTPNAHLEPFTRPCGRVAYKLFADGPIPANTPATIPFDTNWRESTSPLKCFKHLDNMDNCPFERERKTLREAERR